MTDSTDPDDDPLRTDEVIARIMGDFGTYNEAYINDGDRDFEAELICRAGFLYLTGHTFSRREYATISWFGFHLPGSPRALQKPAPRAI